MSITTTCPKCQARFEITDDLADQPISCHRCLHTFDRNGKTPTDGIQPSKPPKPAAPKRLEDDDLEPMPTPRRPTARPAFPWSAFLVVALGILVFLLVLSVGFNVWFLTNPDRPFGRGAALREAEDRARQQAVQAGMAAQQARAMAADAQQKEAARQRDVEDLQRQLQAARDELNELKKK